MAIKLQIRRGTASQWTSADPTLLAGEIGYETDTGNLKIGTGSAVWTALPYWSSSVPALSSAQTSLNHSDYRNAGRFTITASVTSDTPAAWVPASDAPAVLMVTVSGSNVVQVLVSTKTQKAFQRAYDGSAWTTWVSDTLFADSVGTTEIVNDAVTTAKVIDDAITNAKMRNSAALSVIGRSANSTGDPADIAAATDGHVLRRSGTALGFGTLASGAFANNTVGLSVIANQTGPIVLGRDAASSGSVSALSVSTLQTMLGYGADALLNFFTQRDVLAANATTGTLWFLNSVTGSDGNPALISSSSYSVTYTYGLPISRLAVGKVTRCAAAGNVVRNVTTPPGQYFRLAVRGTGTETFILLDHDLDTAGVVISQIQSWFGPTVSTALFANRYEVLTATAGGTPIIDYSSTFNATRYAYIMRLS